MARPDDEARSQFGRAPKGRSRGLPGAAAIRGPKSGPMGGPASLAGAYLDCVGHAHLFSDVALKRERLARVVLAEPHAALAARVELAVGLRSGSKGASQDAVGRRARRCHPGKKCTGAKALFPVGHFPGQRARTANCLSSGWKMVELLEGADGVASCWPSRHHATSSSVDIAQASTRCGALVVEGPASGDCCEATEGPISPV